MKGKGVKGCKHYATKVISKYSAGGMVQKPAMPAQAAAGQAMRPAMPANSNKGGAVRGQARAAMMRGAMPAQMMNRGVR